MRNLMYGILCINILTVYKMYHDYCNAYSLSHTHTHTLPHTHIHTHTTLMHPYSCTHIMHTNAMRSKLRITVTNVGWFNSNTGLNSMSIARITTVLSSMFVDEVLKSFFLEAKSIRQTSTECLFIITTCLMWTFEYSVTRCDHVFFIATRLCCTINMIVYYRSCSRFSDISMILGFLSIYIYIVSHLWLKCFHTHSRDMVSGTCCVIFSDYILAILMF